MDALDLDTSYCIVCNQFIWPERYQVAVETPAPTADPSTVRAPKKTGARSSSRPSARTKQPPQPLRRAASARKSSSLVAPEDVEPCATKLRTVISQAPSPIYCSDTCRSHDVESGNRAETSLKTLFDPSYSPCKPSPISPLVSGSESDLDTDHSNAGYFARLLPNKPWIDRRMSSTSTISMSSSSSTSSGKEYLYENRRRAREYLAESAARLNRTDSPCRSALPYRGASRAAPESVMVLPPVIERPAAVPFTHRRFKDSSHHAMPLPLPTAPDASQLYAAYPLSIRTRSSASVTRESSPPALSSSFPESGTERTPTPSVYDVPSCGSLTAEHTKGLLVRPVLIRSESTSSMSQLSRSWDDENILESLRNVSIDSRSKGERESRKQRKAMLKSRALQSTENCRMFPSGASTPEEVGPTYPVLQIPRPKKTVVKTIVVREPCRDGSERLVERKVTEEVEEEPKNTGSFLTIMSPSSLPPQKKRKITSSDSRIKQIESLETLINKSLAEEGSLNCLADLLDLARSTSDAAILHKALYALYRSFVSIAASPKINLSKCTTEEGKLVRTWLLERVGEYTDLLCSLVADQEKALRSAALQILMSMAKHLSTAFSIASGCPQMHSTHFRKIVSALLVCPPSLRNGGSSEAAGRKVEVDVRDTFVETWLSSYDDVRWFFFRDATALLRSFKDSATLAPFVVENLLAFLERLKTMPTEVAELNSYWIVELGARPPKSTRNSRRPEDEAEEPIPVDEDDWRTFFDDAPPKTATPQTGQPRVHTLSTHQSLHSLASHRAQFSACWMTLLPHIASSAPLAARALAVLHRGVMPHMDKPVRLMDWVGGCVDFGGSIGLLALNALFTLIKDYNLDFPDFYTRLYAFLTRDVMHLKYRARFFRLTEIFLSSTHLPATILASFIKRLSRLSLSAPPAAIVMIIPFVYNVLKQHPALMVMIHRVDDEAELDPFDETEKSPLRTNALESSLWELVSHREHYLPSVSTLAKIFSEVFTKPAYALEDFLDHTYATLFEAEVKRKLKKDPAVALEPAPSPFPTDVAQEAQTGDVVSELWVF